MATSPIALVEPATKTVERRCVFAPGQRIFAEGEMSDYAYLVEAGQVDLIKSHPDGDLRLAVLGPGEIFGEMGLLDDTVRTASAVAQGETVLQALGRQELLELLKVRPEEALKMLSAFSRRLRHADSLIARPEFARAAPAKPSLLARLRDFVRPAGVDLDRIRVEFMPDALEIEERPVPAGARAIVYAVLALFVCGAVWASVATIDRIVVATGKLVTTAGRIVVQPMQTASIRQIHVRPGQIVDKGEILVSLDATFSGADERSVRKQLVSSDAEVRRLEAQLAYAREPGLAPPEPFSDDPDEQLAQGRMYSSWAEERSRLLSSSKAEIEELEAHVRSLTIDKADMARQAESAKRLEAMRLELHSKGIGSLTALLEVQRQLAADAREGDRIDNELRETGKKIETARARLQRSLEEVNVKLHQELQTARREVSKLSEQLTKQQRLQSLIDLRSPSRAVVVEMAARSIGSVVKEGEQLVTLAPLDVPLEIDASIDPKDVSYLRLGDITRIKLDAFPYQKYGTLEGVVDAISGDVVEQEEGGRRVSVYRIKIDITGSNLRDVPKDMTLLPGMSATGEIKVGSRRLITYFLYPVARTLDSGLRDP